MMPERIFLIRHGQSKGNVDVNVFRETPDHAVELTKTGFKQAKRAGNELIYSKTFNAALNADFYVSPYVRTMQTFQTINEVLGCRIVPIYDPRIREREWTNWLYTGKKITDEQWRSFWYRFKDGESCADVYNRVGVFVDELYRKNKASDVVVIGHGTALNVMLMYIFNLHPCDFEKLRNFHNCEIVVLHNVDGAYHINNGIKSRWHTIYKDK